MNTRTIIKTGVFYVATLAVAPALLSFWIRSMLIGRDRALEGSTQALALIPGLPGQYFRRAFLARALALCHATATIEFGTIFSRADARLDANVYIGPRCHLGLVHIERDVLVAAGVHIPSGPDTHGISDLSVPIREQPGNPRMIRVGAGSWIGSAAVILADVGRESVVGAGSVVTRPIPERALAVGTPAKVVRYRGDSNRQSA